MAGRRFVPTMYPLVDPTTGLITGPWVRYQQEVNADLTPGSINEVLTSNGVALVWAKLANANIDAGAAIAYSKLNLALSIVNADVAVAAAIAWSKISKTGSSLADLTTRSAADLSSGTLPDARFPATLPALDGSALTNLTGANISPGTTYTPTLTNVANLDASTAYQCQYLRVGNTVHVTGRVDIDPTLTATSTQLGISLPIASNLGAIEDCAGVAFASGIAGQGAAILGDAANNRAQLEYISGDVSNQAMYLSFSYQVI